MQGKKEWAVGGFIASTGKGDCDSYEAICVLNATERDAKITITVYFEDREPISDFTAVCAARRIKHIRFDKIVSKNGDRIPKDTPFALTVDSTEPIIVQYS